MGGWALVMILLWGIFLPSLGKHPIERMVPEMPERLSLMLKTLLPEKEVMLREAWHLLGSIVIPLNSETERCRNDSTVLFNSLLNNEMWALRMVDASSKPTAGILDGNYQDLGNYDECVAVSAPRGLFGGQHCVVETRGLLPSDEIDKFSGGVVVIIRKDVMFSVCVPDSCTAQDVKTHMNVALNTVNATAIMSDKSCTSAKSQPLGTADYFAITVLFIIVVLVAVSTSYEHLTAKSEQKELLTSFSITSNTAQLLSSTVLPNSLPCLHGIRVFAMAWIILGHRFSELNQVSYRNIITTVKNFDILAWTPMQNITIVVEIFFLLSGILAAYNFFRDRLKGKRFSYLSFCVHRYLRLTPPMLLVMMLYTTVLIRVTDGPIWKSMFGQYQDSCQKNWWINLLYLSNYVVPYNVCIRQTWYLMVDYQLHVLSPLLLLVMHKKISLGFLFAAVVFLVSNSASIAFIYINGTSGVGGFRSHPKLVKTEYIQTHFRLTSFVIGLCLGYILFRIKQQQLKVKLSKPQLWAGWIVSALLFLGTVLSTSVFDNPEYVHNPWLDALYLACRRSTVSLPVAWAVLACTIGSGGIVDKVISWKALIPLSRLTYCAFLLQFLVQHVQTYRTRTLVTIDTLNIWYAFFADFVISYLLATLLYLGVEAPVSNVFNYLFRVPDKEKPTENNVALLTLQQP